MNAVRLIQITIIAFLSILLLVFNNCGGPSATEKLFTMNCPTEVPEGYPYYCKAQVEGVTGGIYFVRNSTCGDLQINPNGEIFSSFENKKGSTCSYSIGFMTTNDSYRSQDVKINIQEPITMQFNASHLNLKKSDPAKGITLTLSRPAPFATKLSYTLQSTADVSHLNDYKAHDFIEIAKGATTVHLSMGADPSADLTHTNYLLFKLNSGNHLKKPEISITLYESENINFDKISKGFRHTCGIKDGKLYCWGVNEEHQLGAGDYTDYNQPKQIGDSTAWTDISASKAGTCGVNNGELFCWGRDTEQRIGNGSSNLTIKEPLKIGSSNTWEAVSTSETNTCAINNGELYCWGRSYYGAVGNGSASTTAVNAPEKVSSSNTWTSISVGTYHACGINNNELYCWGENYNGSTGVSRSMSKVLVPTKVGTLQNWTKVSLAEKNTCGIESGKLYCWGSYYSGQLGLSETQTNHAYEPMQVGHSSDWTDISVNANHTCGVDSGQLFCWGKNRYGLLGSENSSSTVFYIPTQVGQDEDWLTVSTSATHNCATKANSLHCWGKFLYTDYGVDGVSNSKIYSPIKASSMDNWQSVGLGKQHSCAIRSGELYCWGEADHGETGHLTTDIDVISTPEKVLGSKQWTAISAGQQFTCAIKNKELYCWGKNDYGRLGTSTDNNYVTSPERLSPRSGWTQIDSGENHACGINNSNLYCWGYNYWGQVGNNSKNDTLTPAKISNLKQWTAVTASRKNSCGINNGELYCWGDNSKNQAGSGPTENILVPKKISTLKNWTHINSGGHFTCGIESGNLYCWGDATSGVLANGTISGTVDSPTQVGVSDQWTAISTGTKHACGINNGELYCWGNDSSGRLGNGIDITRNIGTPTQIGSSNQWTTVSAGDAHTCGVNNGELYCWGSNVYSQATKVLHTGTPALISN